MPPWNGRARHRPVPASVPTRLAHLFGSTKTLILGFDCLFPRNLDPVLRNNRKVPVDPFNRLKMLALSSVDRTPVLAISLFFDRILEKFPVIDLETGFARLLPPPSFAREASEECPAEAFGEGGLAVARLGLASHLRSLRELRLGKPSSIYRTRSSEGCHAEAARRRRAQPRATAIPLPESG
jgi:hypothetical protein